MENLRLLYDYTKFHIGLYGALMAAFITNIRVGNKSLSTLSITILKIDIGLLLIAQCPAG